MKKKIVIGIIVVLAVAMNMVWLMHTFQSMQENQNGGYVSPKAIQEIRINNDTQFNQTAQQQGWPGNGSASNPYVILKSDFDAQGKGAALYIGNVTVNFTISGCNIYNATGGDGSIYNPGAGIVLYNITGENIMIVGNEINNNKYGIFASNIVNSSYVNIGDWQHPEQENIIYNNTKDGINVTNSQYAGFTVRYNVIFSNNIGIHAYQNSGTGYLEINFNGISLNTQEGVKIEGTDNAYIYGNYFYKNDGSGDKYDENHPQATQNSSNSISWYLYDPPNSIGNFWYDWAENNNTNYDMANGNFTIPWSYPIKDSNDSGNTINFDKYPVKGFHHDAIEINGFSTYILNPKNGFVGVDGMHRYILTGLEINGTVGNKAVGYGLFINSTGSFGGLMIDGVVIHDVDTTSSSRWVYRGNGIAVNHTVILGGLFISHGDIYNCHSNGIGVNNTTGPIYIDNTWIHDGAPGATGLFVYYNVSSVVMYYSTIEHQGHWGVFIGGDGDNIKLFNNIISYNYYGLNMPAGLESINISAYYNSFFKNTYYAMSLKNSTNTNMSFADNIFYGNYGSTDSYDSTRIQVYAEQHSNFSNYNGYIGTRGNYYHDWVNNNFSNDMNNDGIVDWGYHFKGGNIVDNMPKKWVDFRGTSVYYDSLNGYYSESLVSKPIYVDDSNWEYLRARGTSYGIVGYDGTYYYIVGWHKTMNYTDSYGFKYGIYIKTSSAQSFKIYNVKVENAPTGIHISGTNLVNISRVDVSGCNGYEGIFLIDVPNSYISYSKIHDNKAGLEAYRYISSINIYQNWIYGNQEEGIYLPIYSNPSAPLIVHNNYIFGNGIGLRGNPVKDTYITDNGFAYNQFYGVKLEGSNGNYIYNNTFYYNNGTSDSYSSNNKQAYDNGNNYWNNTKGYGNYWHDFSVNNNTNDNNHDDIVDYAYPIGGGSNKDNYPQLYMHRDPITINGVGDMKWSNGYVGGNGTKDYPYLIAGWEIEGSSKDGMYLANISKNAYIKIDHCLVNDSSGSGIRIYQSKPKQIYLENIISMNNTHNGVKIEYSWNVTVDHSKTTHNYQSGVNAYNSNYVNVYYSNMSENSYQGFNSYGSYNINLENNTMYNNGYNGVNIEQTDITNLNYGKIVNNTLKLNTQYGVKLVSSSGFIIYHNIFDRNNGSSGNGTYNSSHIQAYDNAAQYTNLWNTTTEGNCWSDNSTSNPYHIDGGNSKDYNPGCAFVPELQGYIFVVLALIGLISVTRIRRRRH